MSIDSILGQAEKAKSESTKKNEYADNKEMFLQLLVAQLSNQDPLNPAEDTEYIAQLATFTQVEELQNLNVSMNTLVEAYDRQQFISATSLLEKRILAAGSTVSKITDSKTGEYGVTPVYFTSEADMSNVTINVYGPGGYTIYSEELGALQAGSYPFTWDGTYSATGTAVKDGVYNFAVVAYDLNGNRVLTTNQVFGDVTQVEKTDEGYSLHLLDGRTVKLEDVTMAGYYYSSGTEEKKEENTETP